MELNVIRKSLFLLEITNNLNIFFLRFDGTSFGTAGSTKEPHTYTLGIANYGGKALTTGCEQFSSCFTKTELMDMSTLEWSNGTDYSLTW